MLLRSTLIYTPAVLFSRLSSLLLLIVCTRLMNQTEYGLLALVVTVGEMTDAAVSGWLRVALLRLGGQGEVTRGSLNRAARSLALTTTLALLVSVLVAQLIVPERWLEFALASGFYLVASGISRFGLTILQMQHRQQLYTLVEFARSLLALVFPVLAVMWQGPSFFPASLATSAAMFGVGVGTVWLAFSRAVPGAARYTFAELAALGMPLVLMALLGFGISSAERLVLNGYYDPGAVALYVAAYALARQPIDVVANAINMGAFPELVSRFDRDGPAAADAFLGQQLSLMLRLCLPIAALLVALAGNITDLVLPADYRDTVVQVFPIIVVGVLLINLESFIFNNIFHMHKRNWLLIGATAPASLGGIVLAFLFIPQYGAVGAALASTGGALLALVLAIVLSRPLSRFPIDYRGIAQSAGVALACGLTSWVVEMIAPHFWPLLNLVLSGTAGGLVFLGLTALLHPEDARRLTGAVLGRLRSPRAREAD